MHKPAVFTAHDAETVAVVRYPDRPDTADRRIHARALDGACTILGESDDPNAEPGDLYVVTNASGVVWEAWSDELEPHRDTYQTYDAVTDPHNPFVTHCTCGHTTRGMDPDDADAKMLDHANANLEN